MKLYSFFAALCLHIIVTLVNSQRHPVCARQKCTSQWHPVCASNKVTYFNLCEFDYLNCKLHDNNLTSVFGDCAKTRESSAPTCECTKEYDPMCTSDVVHPTAFINQCFFNCYKKNVNHKAEAKPGECPAGRNSADRKSYFVGMLLLCFLVSLIQ